MPKRPSPEPIVTCSREPSDEAWRRAGKIAATLLYELAERDARAEAERLAAADDREPT